jgi:hypothetical protein
MLNRDELHPVSGENTEQRLPSNIRIRISELYRSFILGNFLAALALSRAILEYALRENCPRLDIDAYRRIGRTSSKRARRLGELVQEVSEKLPVLKLSMETVVEAGNRALHPEKKDKLVLAPDQQHDLALKSVNAIRDVIEKLYLRREGDA